MTTHVLRTNIIYLIPNAMNANTLLLRISSKNIEKKCIY